MRIFRLSLKSKNLDYSGIFKDILTNSVSNKASCIGLTRFEMVIRIIGINNFFMSNMIEKSKFCSVWP